MAKLRLSCSYGLRVTVILVLSVLQFSQTKVSADANASQQQISAQQSFEEFCQNQRWCASLTGIEKLALEAIKYLHSQLDDDQNGSIDLRESDGFLREELQYAKGAENRHKNFHRNNDHQISVKNLWDLWITSEVHNWTVQQTVDWLSLHVGLPDYGALFFEKEMNGTYLPLLAANQQHYISQTVGIKDPRHKKKLCVKAQDAVLFGSPKDNMNTVKDVILSTSLALALTAIWVVYRRYKSSQGELLRKHEEIEKLSRAADELKQLQLELDKTKIENGNISNSDSQATPDQTEELGKLREEVHYLRERLQRTESELSDKYWIAPPQLERLLLATYDLEKRQFAAKHADASKRLSQARDACEQLKEKRKSVYRAFLGSVDNSKDIGNVEAQIAQTTAIFNALTSEKREMVLRWKEIGALLNINFLSNDSMTMNRSLGSIGRTASSGSARSSSTRPTSILHDSRESLHDDTRL